MALAVTMRFNADGATALLSALKEKLADMSPATVPAAEALRTHVEDNFEGEHSSEGIPWAELSPETLASRRPGKILQQTSSLRRGVHAEGSRTGITFGVSGPATPYGATHQFGWGGIPARPFLPIDASGRNLLVTPGTPAGELWLEIQDAFRAHLLGPKKA